MKDKCISHFLIPRLPCYMALIASLLCRPPAAGHCQSAVAAANGDAPSYSAKATYTESGRAAISPDGKAKVQIKRDADNVNAAEVVAEGQQGTLSVKIGFGLDTEVLWSPDSRAFTVSGSEEGANGLYETSVFYFLHGRLKQVELTPLITQAFGHPVKCGWPEPPNVAAVRWIVPSKKLLVTAEIIHHSNCDSFGTFRAYAVDLNGPQIVKEYDQLKTKRLFGGDLGPELLQADDNCIRNPPACFVPFNHPELQSAQ
jgi:hypothetical protein